MNRKRLVLIQLWISYVVTLCCTLPRVQALFITYKHMLIAMFHLGTLAELLIFKTEGGVITQAALSTDFARNARFGGAGYPTFAQGPLQGRSRCHPPYPAAQWCQRCSPGAAAKYGASRTEGHHVCATRLRRLPLNPIADLLGFGQQILELRGAEVVLRGHSLRNVVRQQFHLVQSDVERSDAGGYERASQIVSRNGLVD